MNKRKILTALAASALVVVGGYGASVIAATSNGTALATIVAPLTVAPNAGGNVLSFGDISPDSTGPGGTVTVSPAGVITAYTGVGLAGGTVDYGGFDVSGCNNCAFTVTVPAGAATLTGINFGATMTVDTWTSTNSSPLDGTGAGTVNVGATLNVGANQTADDYTGTYVLTVNYP